VNLWVYKCRNNKNTRFSAYGNWDEVFAQPWTPKPWGGAWATERSGGKEIFDNEIQVGDLVLAWQSGKGAVGLCEVTGRTRSKQHGTDIVLVAIEQFPKPVNLHETKRSTMPELAAVPALKQGNAGTIYRTTAREARLLLKACGAKTRLVRRPPQP
jgi:hypothetical protein